jgi:protein involved in polysaccharide export with SLBB domain
MISKYFSCAAIVLLGLQLMGCFTDYGPVASSPEPVLQSGDVADRLVPGEKLRVTVYGEDTLTGSYMINPAGYIVMPLIGDVRAAGVTAPDLAREISGRFAGQKLLQEPKVTVDIVEYRPIYVLGEALRPGAYPYTSGLNVLTAITLAGGFTYRASRKSVLIEHAGDSVWQEYPLSASVLIAPGDLIRVPERYF